jgi:hypothetical protein
MNVPLAPRGGRSLAWANPCGSIQVSARQSATCHFSRRDAQMCRRIPPARGRAVQGTVMKALLHRRVQRSSPGALPPSSPVQPCPPRIRPPATAQQTSRPRGTWLCAPSTSAHSPQVVPARLQSVVQRWRFFGNSRPALCRPRRTHGGGEVARRFLRRGGTACSVVWTLSRGVVVGGSEGCARRTSVRRLGGWGCNVRTPTASAGCQRQGEPAGNGYGLHDHRRSMTAVSSPRRRERHFSSVLLAPTLLPCILQGGLQSRLGSSWPSLPSAAPSSSGPTAPSARGSRARSGQSGSSLTARATSSHGGGPLANSCCGPDNQNNVLLRLSVVRDEARYREYVEGSASRLRRTAFLVCGDWHRAEDAVQSVLGWRCTSSPRATGTPSTPGSGRPCCDGSSASRAGHGTASTPPRSCRTGARPARRR